MNRAIKFRVWDEIDNEMREVALLKWDNGHDLSRIAGWLAPMPGVNFHQAWRDAEPPYRYKLMQFTGLQDINTRDIYEGDILERGEVVKIGDFYAYIENLGGYNITGVYKEFKQDGQTLQWPIENRKEKVIGNIYENPELLSTPAETVSVPPTEG